MISLVSANFSCMILNLHSCPTFKQLHPTKLTFLGSHMYTSFFFIYKYSCLTSLSWLSNLSVFVFIVAHKLVPIFFHWLDILSIELLMFYKISDASLFLFFLLRNSHSYRCKIWAPFSLKWNDRERNTLNVHNKHIIIVESIKFTGNYGFIGILYSPIKKSNKRKKKQTDMHQSGSSYFKRRVKGLNYKSYFITSLHVN